MKRQIILWALLLLLPVMTGCVAAVVGTGVAVGYGAVTDERPVGKLVDDKALAVQIRTKLTSYSDIAARRITIDVVEGTVYLLGLTDSAEKKQAITRIVGDIKGVLGVDNLLIIGSRSTGEYLSDKTNEANIKGAMAGTPHVRSLNVYVTSVKGVIFLVGKIRTEEERRLVHQVVKDAVPNAQVVDRIRISQNPNPPGTSEGTDSASAKQLDSTG